MTVDSQAEALMLRGYALKNRSRQQENKPKNRNPASAKIRILKVTFVAAGQEIIEKALATTVVGAVFVFRPRTKCLRFFRIV